MLYFFGTSWWTFQSHVEFSEIYSIVSSQHLFKVGAVSFEKKTASIFWGHDPIFMLVAPIIWGHDPNFSQVVWTELVVQKRGAARINYHQTSHIWNHRSRSRRRKLDCRGTTCLVTQRPTFYRKQFWWKTVEWTIV